MNVRDLAVLAAYEDPRLAFWLLKSDRKLKEFSMFFEFNDGVAGRFVEKELNQKNWCDYFVIDMSYTVRRPNAFDDSPFKAPSDAAFVQVPYMSIDLEVQSCPDFQITDESTAIELAARPANVPIIARRKMFPLLNNDNLRARITLDTDFAESVLPIQVHFMTLGYLLSCRQYNQLTVADSIKLLRSEYNIVVDPNLLSTNLRREIA
jgi:hypothetical protein